MSNKTFAIVIAVLALGLGVFISLSKSSKDSSQDIVGIEHEIQGAEHIARGQEHEPYSTDLPSSGPHYSDQGAPTLWGIYSQEVPPEVFVHNLEHGGIVIAYNPDLPSEQLDNLTKLFVEPYSNPDFQPNKFIITPRANNTSMIQLAAWGWTLNLEQFDEDQITKFYLQRVGKAPEPAAGPNNKPINQSSSDQEPVQQEPNPHADS